MGKSNKRGHFGEFGGQYVAETLLPALIELEKEFDLAWNDEVFLAEYRDLLKNYVGRESALYYAKRLTEYCGGAKIYLKREDLNHTGAHKVNNTLGQALLAKRMGKNKLIAETGAGMHGVATATAAALLGMECVVYMGEEDVQRQASNVSRMKMLGAKVIPVTAGTATLKDAMNEALRIWVSKVQDTFYVIGTVAGPHPYPIMVREFQKVIGEEVRVQILEKEGRLPDEIIACIGGGSNAMGIFWDFIKEKDVRLRAVEAAGKGIDTTKHACSMLKGRVGVLHGNKTYLLQDNDGQIHPTHSISAGLDYPGVGPEHAHFFETGRLDVTAISDAEAVDGFQKLCRLEGIIPALESSHAIAECIKRAAELPKEEIIVVNLSGRGDKDMASVIKYLEIKGEK